MSPAAKRPRRPQNTVPESLPQQNDIPPESTTTVILKTVMELKEDLGGVKQDLSYVKQELDRVSRGLADVNKWRQSVNNTFKWVVVIGAIGAFAWSTLLYLVANWNNLKPLIRILVD